MHYYQFNISDYKAHTCHLTPMEDLAYRRLIDFYYLHEKPIGFDIDQIARKIQMQEYKTEIENVLNEFFEQDENGFFQKRVEEEIQKFHGYITKQSENGRKGGRPPSQDKNPPLLNKKPKPNPVDMKPETQKKPKQEPLTTNQEPLNNNQETINNSSSSCLSFGEKLQHEQDEIFNKNIDLVHNKPRGSLPPPVIPIGAPEGAYTKDKTFFIIKIKDTGQVIPEQDWIKQQLFINANKQDTASTLDEALMLLPNQVKIFRKWIKHPLATRMSAYAITVLFSNANEELSYARRVAEKRGGSNAVKFNEFTEICEQSILAGDYEVVV